MRRPPVDHNGLYRSSKIFQRPGPRPRLRPVAAQLSMTWRAESLAASARSRPKQRARPRVPGLTTGLPQVDCSTIVEHAKCATPEAGCSCSPCPYVITAEFRYHMVDHLGGPDADLAVAETGNLKKAPPYLGRQGCQGLREGMRVEWPGQQASRFRRQVSGCCSLVNACWILSRT